MSIPVLIYLLKNVCSIREPDSWTVVRWWMVYKWMMRSKIQTIDPLLLLVGNEHSCVVRTLSEHSFGANDFKANQYLKTAVGDRDVTTIRW